MERNNKSKGGRTPLPEKEKRKHCVGTKLNDMELQILEAKIQEYKMSMYEYLRRALTECKISEKDYKKFLNVVDEFSISHVMRLCIIQYAFLDSIFVIESYRHNGIASSLLKEMKSYYRSINVKNIELYVLSNNTNAIKCYIENGFSNQSLRMELSI